MKSNSKGLELYMKSNKNPSFTGNIMCRYLMAFLFILLGTIDINAQNFPIERVQREYQARYHYEYNGFIKWRSAPNRPTPFFPKDGFYGDLSKNPDFCVLLVRDLVREFFVDTRIYRYFYKYNYIEGLSNLSSVYYTQSDFDYIDPASVNKQNYETHLAKIFVNLTRLRYHSIYPLNYPYNIQNGAIIGYGSSTNKDNAINNANNNWDYNYSINNYDWSETINMSKYYETETQISGNQTNYYARIVSGYDNFEWDLRDINSTVNIFYLVNAYPDGLGSNWPWWAAWSGAYS